MSIIGKIKIFWSEHGNPILLAILVVGSIILIVQGLNKLAIRQGAVAEGNNVLTNNTVATNNIESATVRQEKRTIQQFLTYNQNQQIEEAYNMLSANCKASTYPTLKDYKEKYCNQYFSKEQNVEIEVEKENRYKIIFYKNNAIETGTVNSTIDFIQYYQIEREGTSNKIIISAIK